VLPGDAWVANGMNWTGHFWTATGSIDLKAISLVGSEFWGYDPSKPRPSDEPYWTGFEVGVGKSLGKSKNTSRGVSANVQRQYYYLLYGNGRDYLRDKSKEDVSGLNFWNPKDPEDEEH